MSSDSMLHGLKRGPAKLGAGFARIGAVLGRWDHRGWLTIVGFALVLLIGGGGAIWGGVWAKPDIRIQEYDAGPVSKFAISEVAPYPDVNVYLVGLADGRIRALDGIVKETGCAVQWLPDDRRAVSANPDGRPGAYLDACSGAVWTLLGNAFSGTIQPLRTFEVEYFTNTEGVQHVWVEVLGHREGRS
jgi:hypothetical protein